MIRLSPLSTLNEADLREATELLAREFDPHAIYLFGSHTWGAPHPDSDVDIMVVLRHGEPTPDDYGRALRVLKRLVIPIEPHLSSRERFERFAPVFGTFANDVRRKGVLLYAAEE
jgi:predicted nucleotidyltransferase